MKVISTKTRKIFLILIISILFLFTLSFLYIPPWYEPHLETGGVGYSYNDEDNSVEDFVKATTVADSIISEKIGEEFFSKYLKFDPVKSRIVRDTENYNYKTGESYTKQVYYDLYYKIIIPEIGIEENLLHDVPEIEFSVYERDGIMEHDEKYGDTPIPDCHNIQRCFEMMDREEAMKVLVNDMRIRFTRAKADYFVWNIYTEQWEMRYEPPVYKTPFCSMSNGGYGGYVRIQYDSLNDNVTERSFECHVGDLGI